MADEQWHVETGERTSKSLVFKVHLTEEQHEVRVAAGEMWHTVHVDGKTACRAAEKKALGFTLQDGSATRKCIVVTSAHWWSGRMNRLEVFVDGVGLYTERDGTKQPTTHVLPKDEDVVWGGNVAKTFLTELARSIAEKLLLG